MPVTAAACHSWCCYFFFVLLLLFCLMCPLVFRALFQFELFYLFTRHCRAVRSLRLENYKSDERNNSFAWNECYEIRRGNKVKSEMYCELNANQLKHLGIIPNSVKIQCNSGCERTNTVAGE